MTRHTTLIPKIHPRFECTTGFLLLAALLAYLDDGSGLVPATIIGAVVHEAGHISVSFLFRGKLSIVRLSGVGIEIGFTYPKLISYSAENIVLLAGPVFSLAFAAVSFAAGYYMGAAVSLGLGFFNLLPILPLDGGRLWLNLISSHFGPRVGETALTVTAGIVIGLAAGVGTIILIRFANGALLMLSVWMLLHTLRLRQKRYK